MGMLPIEGWLDPAALWGMSPRMAWACRGKLPSLISHRPRPRMHGDNLTAAMSPRKAPMTEWRRYLIIGFNVALFADVATGALASAQGIDPDAEIAVCTTPYLLTSPYATGDGLGGVLITWVDLRNDTLGDVYVQRIDSRGLVKWQANGVAICSANGAQTHPTAIADGSGGAYVAWQDRRGTAPRVYVQRVDHAGLPVFAGNGLPVRTAAGAEVSPAITEDGAGGAFVAWLDHRSGLPAHYAQRIGQDGAPLWSGDGVVVDTSSGINHPPRLLAAGPGRVITLTQKGVVQFVARKFGEHGQPLWSTAGALPCCSGTSIGAVPDGSGGANLVWTEWNQADGYSVVAQRISADGELQWGTNGQRIFASTFSQDLHSIATSGDGGAYVVWRNNGFANPRIYAQRLAPDGAKLWGESGIRAAPVGRNQSGLAIARGSDGDLLVAWQMFFESVDYDMFIQRFDDLGAAQWQSDGSRLPTQSQLNRGIHIEADGTGGAWVVWRGVRDGTAMINTERINRWGFAGPPPAKSANSVSLWSPAPNPTDGAVNIRVAVRNAMRLSLDVIDIAGRHVKAIMSEEVEPGLYSFGWDGKDDDRLPSPAGVYFVRCRTQNGNLVTRVQIVR